MESSTISVGDADDWENLNLDDQEPPIIKTVKRRDDRWEGEDEEEDVKDNWDDDDEEEETEKSEASDVKNVPKKKPLAVRIKEKEEKKRQELEEKKKKMEEEAREKTQEEILADKLEQQRLQEESDLLLAQETFGVSSDKQGSGLDQLKLESEEDFEKFRRLLVDKMLTAEKSPHFVSFLESTFRDVCVSLDVDDIKRISSSLNALWNEKLKAQKSNKNKKKVGAKSSVKIERNALKMDFEDDFVNEFDEFI